MRKLATLFPGHNLGLLNLYNSARSLCQSIQYTLQLTLSSVPVLTPAQPELCLTVCFPSPGSSLWLGFPLTCWNQDKPFSWGQMVLKHVEKRTRMASKTHRLLCLRLHFKTFTELHFSFPPFPLYFPPLCTTEADTEFHEAYTRNTPHAFFSGIALCF